MKRFIKSVTHLAIVAVVAAFPVICQAQSLTRPAGLNPGDEYRIAFVTSGVTNAESDDIGFYNDFVTAQANAADSLVKNLGALWFIMGSTETVGARDNTSTNRYNAAHPSVPIYLVDGISLMASSNDDLWDGSINNLINLDEQGRTQTGFVFTGTRLSGEEVEDASLGLPFPREMTLGNNTYLDSRWVDAATAANDEAYPVYGLSSVLVAVPEPSSLCLLGLASVSWLGRRPRRA